MSYTPTNWATGDVITAEKLNNMESGIVGASGVTVVTFSLDSNQNVTSSLTYQEIDAIYKSGGIVIGRMDSGDDFIALLPLSISFNSAGDTAYQFDGYMIQGLTTLYVISIKAYSDELFTYTMSQYTLTVKS